MDEARIEQIHDELSEALKKARDDFEKACKREIWRLVKEKFGGWPKIPVCMKANIKTVNVPEGPYNVAGTGIAEEAVEIKHIDGVDLGHMTYECGNYHAVFTSKGLFRCESVLIPTMGPLGGNSIPRWKKEEYRGYRFSGPKKISFFEFFEESPYKLGSISFYAGEYRPEIERQIAAELEKHDIFGHEENKYADLRRGGKTAEELDTHPELWQG